MWVKYTHGNISCWWKTVTERGRWMGRKVFKEDAYWELVGHWPLRGVIKRGKGRSILVSHSGIIYHISIDQFFLFFSRLFNILRYSSLLTLETIFSQSQIVRFTMLLIHIILVYYLFKYYHWFQETLRTIVERFTSQTAIHFLPEWPLQPLQPTTCLRLITLFHHLDTESHEKLISYPLAGPTQSQAEESSLI